MNGSRVEPICVIRPAARVRTVGSTLPTYSLWLQGSQYALTLGSPLRQQNEQHLR